MERVDDKVHPTIAIFDEELPLRAGLIELGDGLSIPSCIRDAVPGADLGELTYLLESGSERLWRGFAKRG